MRFMTAPKITDFGVKEWYKNKKYFIVEENKKDYNGVGEQVKGEKGYEGMA